MVVDPLRDRASGQSVRLSELTGPDEAAQIYARLWIRFTSEEGRAGTTAPPIRGPGGVQRYSSPPDQLKITSEQEQKGSPESGQWRCRIE
ncbi:hypothetical protein ATP06_0236235 [Amycolatopsis regifaucium]|uniref:Ig-like domain-containing protein n=1 Tax=Amycolatopsis regifaucium TaxID=546365 RepID=A0ABX3DG37_9PSEU|nr:hypothetical protein ATP06_0236235 [Amycolatopsis regifaucium]